MTLEFPEGFLFGAATSAVQIEGGARTDGRGESIWDRYAADPARIEDRSEPSVACDHYRLWRAEIDLLRWLGLDAYRFSISWTRVLPSGRRTEINGVGLDFYDRLVDALLDAGIRPMATLNHWDLPLALEDAGGWPARATVDAFVDYAEIVSRRLGDRVSHWVTHNEPSIVAWLGHLEGVHAPGRESWPDALATAHHLLLSHGRAVPVLRANAPKAQVGITLMLSPGEPASPSGYDLEACRAFDGQWNRWFLDPLYGHGYPSDAVGDLVAAGHVPRSGLPFVEAGDFEAIATPTDFLGVNFYTRAILRSREVDESANAPRTVVRGSEVTDMGWEVHPESLTRLLLRVKREYRPPRLYITENGAAYATAPDAEGRIRDVQRTAYLDGHLRALLAALEEEVPVAGYYVWSLLDNWEWAHGFTKRFGLFWVDFATQARLPKDSAYWYRSVVAARRLPDSPIAVGEAGEGAFGRSEP